MMGRQERFALLPSLGLLALAAVMLILGACSPAPTATGQAASVAALPREISAKEALAKRQAGAFVLDVRDQWEWNEYHVPNSTLIPLAQLPSRLSELPRDREIVVVCRSGNHSATGRDILMKAGFPSVTSLGGGLLGWRSSQYPTVTGP